MAATTAKKRVDEEYEQTFSSFIVLVGFRIGSLGAKGFEKHGLVTDGHCVHAEAEATFWLQNCDLSEMEGWLL